MSTGAASERDRRTLLGEFLRARRRAIDPDSTGIPSYGRRRTPGLRREEVAVLAGVSTSYYVRIEQGSVAPSVEILEALAVALRLGEEDRGHLHRLSLPRPWTLERPCGTEDERAGLDAVVAHLSLPAGILGPDLTLRAWNRSAWQIFSPHRDFDIPWSEPSPSWVRWAFLDPFYRDLYEDWEWLAVDLTARLRASYPGTDGAVADVVDGLRADSADFARYWDRHHVRIGPGGRPRLRHPRLGPLHLRDVTLKMTQGDPAGLFVFHADPGTRTDSVLRSLAAECTTSTSMTGTPGPPPDPH